MLVLQGSQQGLDLVAKMLVNPGDVIITESPTFVGALIAFAPCEPRYRGVRTDNEGMDVDQLEHLLRQQPRARLIYTIPDFQNPKGVSLSAARRRRALSNSPTSMMPSCWKTRPTRPCALRAIPCPR